jgi:hypothetical protein
MPSSASASEARPGVVPGAIKTIGTGLRHHVFGTRPPEKSGAFTRGAHRPPPIGVHQPTNEIAFRAAAVAAAPVAVGPNIGRLSVRIAVRNRE